MKTFRDLYIRLSGHSIDDFIARVAASCHAPWHRAIDEEEKLPAPGSMMFSFGRKTDSALPGAFLFIANKEGDLWYVSNIVPTERAELGYDRYNNILIDFEKNVLRPAIAGTRIEVDLTGDYISIRDVAGGDVEDALSTFSKLANKSTGSSHPLDRERWFHFLVLANKQRTNLQTDLVIQTLIDLGWSDERAYELGIEFEFAQDLLNYFKGH
jgi:hypothetical protein